MWTKCGWNTYLMHSRQKGNIAEDKACDYLVKQGYRVIERNFYSKYGEIDIIAIKNNILYFVEVKSGESFDPSENITFNKLERIEKTLYIFLKRKNLTLPYNISAIILTNNRLEFIENITI